LLVAGGLVRLATSDETVATALPEPEQGSATATLHVGLTAQLASCCAQAGPIAKGQVYLPDNGH